ncbi:MAG: hydroxyacid dehydrogenase [Gemmatimonadetes bacterium]|nr:hydroxyacid dehydrogenase [Gemmatimonadota bacterium]
MHITFFEIREPWERDYLGRALPNGSPAFLAEPLTAATAELAGAADIVSVFIRSRIDAAVLDHLPALRLLTTRSSGYDHIDVAACAARGVAVANVPRYGENTVAEHTFGLILNLSRRIHTAYERTRLGRFSLEGLEGTDLRGKVLGVVGAGSIGLHVIRIARAFGMEVLAHDVRPLPLIAEVLDFRYVPLDELLRESDVVTLHAPLLPETHHLLNRERFAMMKRGALVVNTARGALIDTEALLRALDEGIVAGAGLDVLEGEEALMEEEHLFRTPASELQLRQVLGGHELLRRENVIITPHIAWYSREARTRILETTAETIEAFADGRVVNAVGR